MLKRLAHGRCPALILLLLLSGGQLNADGMRIIELNDGSRISGRVVSLQDGIYTIESDSLGGLRLSESEILSIRSGTLHGEERIRGNLPENFNQEALQNRILQDPQLMTEIMALQNDQQIQEILADPEILQHLQSGNITILTQDPRIIELLNNPSIRQIRQKIMGH